jgi:hypothetical protein
MRDFVEITLKPVHSRADLGHLLGHYLFKAQNCQYLGKLVQDMSLIIWTTNLKPNSVAKEARDDLVKYLGKYGTPLMAKSRHKVWYQGCGYEQVSKRRACCVAQAMLQAGDSCLIQAYV